DALQRPQKPPDPQTPTAPTSLNANPADFAVPVVAEADQSGRLEVIEPGEFADEEDGSGAKHSPSPECATVPGPGHAIEFAGENAGHKCDHRGEEVDDQVSDVAHGPTPIDHI
ncbi:hypothetical protein, partial [Actinoplanes subtropicus]|uniref:hypothetical protein n=1 Tax=Actinoplanes subtropicus TaxID=543632 RepID=UPI001B80DF69